jgi:hypothetical protein
MFFVFNFEDFILYVELIVLQSSFIRIKKKNAEIFFLIKKETKVFGFFCRILYMALGFNVAVSLPNRDNDPVVVQPSLMYTVHRYCRTITLVKMV